MAKKEAYALMNFCEQLHSIFNTIRKHSFPFEESRLPKNGIYVLFQKGEKGHAGDRIVRVGTHTGENQLRSRLKQHFLNPNKDRSIFRKNIGRALLNKEKDPFLNFWEIDLTTSKNKEKYKDQIDFKKQREIEKDVSSYIQKNFFFSAFEVPEKDERLKLEALLISTVSLCHECQPASDWFGNHSPKNKIRESGLWQVNELYKKPVDEDDFQKIKQLCKSCKQYQQR